nr:aminoglycoside phosphotransferase family protein [Methylomonas fluvii]
MGNGLINDTYLVTSNNGSRFVLQGLNGRVFPEPERVIANLQRLNRHIGSQRAADVHLQIPVMLPTLEGSASYRDDSGQVWRALQLIEPAESREHISNSAEASQVGFALAHFHKLCANLPATELHDTLPGFHITPSYFETYRQRLAQPLQVIVDAAFNQCRDFIDRMQQQIPVLEHAKQRGELRERVIHGDPKLNNFLFEPGSDRIVSLIDLDTVKPGLVHYDIGDCLRSCCHNPSNNEFDLARCQTILESYLQEAGEFFTANDYDYLYPAIWLIPFELGLRFFSDYLDGNQYFKVSTPRQNLERAQALFDLCGSIERQKGDLQQLLAKRTG